MQSFTRQGSLEASVYPPLDGSQIRLVKLGKGHRHDPISLELTVTPLTNLPDFEALSYVVGQRDTSASAQVIRTSYVNGPKLCKAISISRNMDTILRQFRLQDRDRLLWIDAISIDQQNTKERGDQILKMGEIFHAARNVCIWLGPASTAEESDLAMEFIPTLRDFHEVERSVQDINSKSKWLALSRLMARDFFGRRWVVQEMALAKHATVHCGSRTVSWANFAHATSIFESSFAELSESLGRHGTDQLGDIHGPGASSMVRISSGIFRKTASGDIVDRCYDLETLLWLLPMFAVTEPLDVIYSILNLGRDTYLSQKTWVDYNNSFSLVFCDAISHIIKASKSLDIICRPWAPTSYSLPSWVREIDEYAFARRPDGQYERRNADGLLGPPNRPIYSACGQTISDAFIHLPYDRMDPDEPTLLAEGFVLGTVAAIGDRCVNGNIPSDWHRLGGWRRSEEPIPQNYMRTLVADRDAKGDPIPTWYAESCAYCLVSHHDRDLDTSRLSKRSLSRFVKAFIHRLQVTTWNRRLMQVNPIKDREYLLNTSRLGLGPAKVQVNDSVVILSGCSVPVILRSNGKGDWDTYNRDAPVWKMVGECFVYGVMDGEAMRLVQGDLECFRIL